MLPPNREDRARAREEARERRSAERAEMAQARSDRRAVEREEASREREARRATRLDALPSRRSAEEGEREPAPKRRPSGSLRRTGEIRVERDTRHFATVVDTRRIRELARRGAKVDGLATVFKKSVEEIEAILAGDEPTT
ncbi:hypothetical protein EOD43_16970 [Sphingomonas crocodyli]|uniref:Translation initiation factor IF-2 n=1 Tax=Sphingomonas crocodyli TaxID=1979270 RepID=A0A437M164_9SPHN|nr:hypothetical protein EOD43_16970 [Sphingomonas crocodyli]